MQVESEHLADVEWNEGVLTVRFKDTSVYEYQDVPNGVFQELLAAPSKSSFFRGFIKGVYEYARVG